MANSVNFTLGAPTNSTTPFFGPMGVLNIFSLLFGFSAHSYIIWLIITGTGSGVASRFFNLNFSVCEMGICLSSLLFLLETWTPLTITQTVRYGLAGLGITGRPLFQCLICVERYLAVVHPVTFLKSKPLRYRLICCAFVWILTLGSCLFCFFIVYFFYVHVCFFSVQYVLFLSIQLFCLVAVLRALKQSGPGDRRREQGNHMKRRAFYLILIISVSMTVTYIPFTISGLFYIMTTKFLPEMFNVGIFCFILAGYVQPVLFLNRVGKLSCCLLLKS